jgi:hypothetical protein
LLENDFAVADYAVIETAGCMREQGEFLNKKQLHAL